VALHSDIDLSAGQSIFAVPPRERMPELRPREQASNAELQAIADRSVTRAVYLRLAETLNTFLTRLRSSAGALDVSERRMRATRRRALCAERRPAEDNDNDRQLHLCNRRGWCCALYRQRPDGRMYTHFIEAKRTSARCPAKTAHLYPRLHEKLVEKVRAGSQIIETVITSGFTDRAA
jgi:hypothetical protein